LKRSSATTLKVRGQAEHKETGESGELFVFRKKRGTNNSLPVATFSSRASSLSSMPVEAGIRPGVIFCKTNNQTSKAHPTGSIEGSCLRCGVQRLDVAVRAAVSAHVAVRAAISAKKVGGLVGLAGEDQPVVKTMRNNPFPRKCTEMIPTSRVPPGLQKWGNEVARRRGVVSEEQLRNNSPYRRTPAEPGRSSAAPLPVNIFDY